MGLIWRITSATLDVALPSPCPQTCVPQRPCHWIPIPTIGELPARWPVAGGDVDYGSGNLPRDGVGSKPRSELSLADGAAGDGEHQRDDLFLPCVDSEAVQAEKDVRGLEGHTLVSIHERMVVRQGESVGGREGTKIGVGFVDEAVAGAVHR